MQRSLLLPLSLVAALATAAVGIDSLRPPGQRPLEASIHALMGARVVVKPGQELEKANVILRDGRIVAVGADVSAPPDARLHDLTGATIYAGFIDAHVSLAGSTARTSPVEEPPPVAGRGADEDLTAGAGSGFLGVASAAGEPGTKSLVTPRLRVADAYAPDKKALDALRAEGFTAANVVPDGGGIIRGVSAFVSLGTGDRDRALIRPETFQHIALEAPKAPGPEPLRPRPYPGSLMGIVATIRQTLLDARHQIAGQAHAAAHPGAGPRPAFDPDLEALAPVVQKSRPVVFEPGAALLADRSLHLAREFDLQPILLASGQEWRRPDLVRAARAPFIVPLDFPEVAKLPEAADWDAVPLDQLRAWDHAPGNAALLRREGREIALTTHGLGKKSAFRRQARLAIARGLAETDAIAALTTAPAALCGVADQLGTIEPGKLAHLTIFENGRAFDEKARLREVWIDGRQYPAAPAAAEPAKPKPPSTRDTLTAAPAQQDRGPLLSPAAVFVKNATLWTCGPRGRLERACLLIENGKITAIGPDLKAPAGAHLIDLPGIHVTPGLIDCHSHSLILGGVNEATLPSTAMVRVGDVVNSESETIHQQLAGGLTVANLLHGSANPIGGQSCVVKLREGASPEDLKLAGAPEGIKFALGENVKQSNWGEAFKSRFPQSRMGVPAFHTNRFTAARRYLEALEAAKNGGPPVRRDLELEAIGEILRGERLIHCHSYRQDEILAFLRVMESFNVKVATLQHILEGYKVADEIARHGAGASAFSDWWAFKYEVIDAIPHAGSLMRERGVLVSFNSDSSDLARRLNLEAAKAVKYGGTSEEEALKFVTLNPARQLRIDRWVGSLEPGKDADFAIWSGHPLSTTSLCLQTWIDGKQYFEREAAHRRAAARRAEHASLVEKAKKLIAGSAGDAADPKATAKFFFRALEQRETHLCLDCCLDREAEWRN